jgi:hypothetical protein
MVVIQSVPTGAPVTLDGRPLCQTPCIATGVDRTAIHALEIHADGKVPFGALIDLSQAGQDELLAVLRPLPSRTGSAWVEATCDPPGELRVDDRFVGFLTSQGAYPLGPGEHLVGATNPRQSARPTADRTFVAGRTTTVPLSWR